MSRKKLVGAVVTSIAILAALLAIPYLLENRSGAKRWAAVEKRLLDAGLKLELSDFEVEMPPDAENFAATPIIRSLWEFTGPASMDQEIIYTNSELRDQFIQLQLPKYEAPHILGSWKQGKHMDLKAIVDLLTQDPKFTVPKNGSDAAKIAASFESFSPMLEELDAVALRPRAQLFVELSDSFTENIAAAMPWANDLRSHANFQKARAVSALANGDSQTALNAIRVINQAGRTAGSHPTLIGTLLQSHLLTVIEDITWEGLAFSAWGESQLRIIEDILLDSNLLSDFEYSLNFEIVFLIMGGCDFLKNASAPEFREHFAILNGAASSKELLLFQFLPPGIWDHNKAHGCEALLDCVILPLQEKDFTNPSLLTNRFPKTTPRNFFSKVAAPAYDGIFQSVAHLHVTAELLQLACAMERFRLRNDRYPEKHEELIPEFRDKVPIDIMTNNTPLVYRRIGEGYQIYSVGLNGKDNDGFVTWTSKGKRKWKENDWVWSVPALSPQGRTTN